VLALVLCLAFSSTPDGFVEEHVDSIAVVHVRDGAELVFFFDFVQQEWVCLDHRWLASDMACGRAGDRWSLFWHDDGDDCWRLITADHWFETWQPDSPLSAQQNRPWFARLLAPGLKQPDRAHVR
jgi:hypothetical protein